jgi:hypothetical protein
MMLTAMRREGDVPGIGAAVLTAALMVGAALACTGGIAMAAEHAFEHGFRYDPMAWLGTDQSLQGALVRTLVYERPKEGDQALIDEAIDEALSDQREDGSFEGEIKPTVGAIERVAELGGAMARDEVQRAADWLMARIAAGATEARVFEDEEAGLLPVNIMVADALILAGRRDVAEALETLQWHADNVDDWIGRGCPWGQSMVMRALWNAREVVDTDAALTQALTWVAESINGAGCLSYYDPWSFVKMSSFVSHPVCREVLARQLTLILRAQKPDGSWTVSDRGALQCEDYYVFGALVRHGLMDELLGKPPLPDGWRVIREIPLPAGDIWVMAWDGANWWLVDTDTNVAMAVSGESGEVVRTLELPEGNARGIGWADGVLLVNQGCPWRKAPKRLLRIDPENGEVLSEWPLDFLMHVGGVAEIAGDIWVGDSFFGCLYRLGDAGEVEQEWFSPAGPLATWIAPGGDAVWHVDLWAPFVIKSGLDDDGQYLDSIENPCSRGMGGVGFDGEHVWVLDRANRRLCMIEGAD